MSEFTDERTTALAAGRSSGKGSLIGQGLCLLSLGLLTYYAMFRLPFRCPPRERLWSASYAFGFNNGVAFICLAGLTGLVALFYLRSSRQQRPDSFLVEHSPTDQGGCPAALGVMMLLYVALTFSLYLYSERSAPTLMWETRHFLHRSRLMELYHLQPYTQFQAEYGPLLTSTPVYLHRLLRPLGVSLEQAYFITHFLLNAAGLWCIYYVLSRLRMPAAARKVAFVVLAIAGFAPYMGLNGVLLRYLAPYAALLLGHRLLTTVFRSQAPARWWLFAALTLLLLFALNILLSPEAAVAFAIAWIAYGVLILRSDWRVLTVSIITLCVIGILCWLLLPEAYYGSLLSFSQGANNLPLLPVPHLLLYIGTLLILVPPLLAGSIRRSAQVGVPAAALGGAFGVLCLVMAPGALGRCDLPHVLFFGLGASILLMVRLANQSRRAFTGYLIAYGCVFILLMQVVNLNVFFGVPPRALLSRHGIRQLTAHLRSTSGTGRPGAAAMAALDHYPHLGLPFATFGDPVFENYISRGGQLQPEYYISIVGVYTAAALDRKLRDVSKMEYILVPNGFLNEKAPKACAEYLRSIRQWFLYRPKWPCRAVALNPGAALGSFITAHYTMVERVDSWAILRRSSTLSSDSVPLGSNGSVRERLGFGRSTSLMP